MTLSSQEIEINKLVHSMVLALIDEPERAIILTSNEGGRIQVRVHVSDSDKGKIIGMNGRTARSMRIILAGIGQRLKTPIDLNIESSARS